MNAVLLSLSLPVFESLSVVELEVVVSLALCHSLFVNNLGLHRLDESLKGV